VSDDIGQGLRAYYSYARTDSHQLEWWREDPTHTRMTSLVDRYLLYRIRVRQDAEAFAKIYDRYVTQIYRFVLLKLPAREDAEDLTSETFLKCWRYVQEHREVTEIRALLYQIARNSIADWYRERGTPARTLAVTFQPESPSSIAEGDVTDAGRGRAIVEARAELAMVAGKLERLKDDYRDVLMLRLIDDLPFDLIGEIMEKPAGSVRVLYHRAKKALEALDE
jgi:RNA polymerase sigma-70 factor (ECF subfamily)